MIAAERVRQFVCGLHGHDTLLQFAADRMFLRCVSCGFETPGWSLDEPPPTITAQRASPLSAPASTGWIYRGAATSRSH